MKQPCNFGRAIGQIKMKRKTIWTITFMVTKTGHNFKPKKTSLPGPILLSRVPISPSPLSLSSSASALRVKKYLCSLRTQIKKGPSTYKALSDL